MGGSVDAPPRKRTLKSKTKVKTGCKTCRIRKIKCGEEKPSCRRCVSTGRTCDGYESIFRFAANQSPKHEPETALPLVHAGLPEIAPQDIERLNRCFSIKTMLDVKLGCGEEAKLLLEASRTDPVIQHAISSLRALREDLDATGDGKTAITQQAPSYGYGLRQYNMALSGLVSGMSFQNSNKLKSALLCCQIFISIEQLLGNYDAMAQHIIRGLMIMHESRARPTLDADRNLLPACRDQLPMLDVFIVKLFAAPCNFADAPKASAPVTPVESPDRRTIAPDMRKDLTRISESVLNYLDEVAQAQTPRDALQLELRRSALLRSLEYWRSTLELAQQETGVSDPEPISTSFQRLFHHILQIVLISTLDASRENRLELLAENDKLQSLANVVGWRVRDYRMS
ncbi:hypothetical protein LLEC1_02895 [Akanthomyces lecanii]|uniref:Zn(2)-C6 fungal-type domain-containing protein n=1 Tax=Cordyceps confragosa TaxID=2714763 RepID=A0A179I6L0_CORDF|nr:hypothetical protein LLEC1_02895 [Akanthomyces lecanii]